MKRSTLLAVTLLAALALRAQDAAPPAAIPAEYPGGTRAFLSWVLENLQYPAEVKARGIEGKMVAHFAVDTAGRVVNATVTQPLDSLLDAEILRVMALSPPWQPATQHGRVARMTFSIPFVFNMTAESPAGPAVGAYSLNEVDIPPRLQYGSNTAYRNWVLTNMEHPKDKAGNMIPGRVRVGFVIDKSGEVTDVTLLEASSPALGESVLKVMAESLIWNPGRKGGQPVAVWMEMPLEINERALLAASADQPVGVMPTFSKKGGMRDFTQWVIRELYDELRHYPLQYEGQRVVAGITIDTLGRVTNIEIISSTDLQLNRIIVNLLSRCPRWTPGSIDGRPVNVRYTLPITMQLTTTTQELPSQLHTFPSSRF